VDILVDILQFFKDHEVDADFDESFYSQMYPETEGFYQPFCEESNVTERQRLFYHWYHHGRQLRNSKNAEDHFAEYRMLPPTQDEISIVLGCMNRERMLNIAIRSWIYYPEIKEIIITDWNSKHNLKYFEEADPRIKVIRVEDKEYYNASTPVNMAIKAASCETIMKLDADYIINPYGAFSDLINIQDNEFITGDWRDTEIDNKLGFVKGANGFLCVRKKHIEAAGYYNEDIENYGREDCEMFERLENLGLNRKRLQFDSENIPLYHNPHADFFRSQNFKEKNIRKSATYLSTRYGVGTFDLVINLYRDENPERRYELLSCLRDNLKNKYIGKVHVFLEREEFFPEYAEIAQEHYDQLITHKITGRPSFKSLFDYCEKQIRKKCIIANSDIVFTEDLEKVRGVRPFHVICLTRWENGKVKQLTKKGKTIDNIFSQDAWIINPPMYNYEHVKFPEGMKIGTMFSDPGIVYFLKNSGLLMYNLAPEVRIDHRHEYGTPVSDYIADENHPQRAIDGYNEFWRNFIKEPQDPDHCFVEGVKFSTLEEFYRKEKGNDLMNWHTAYPPSIYGI
jgi:hypothetical protein